MTPEGEHVRVGPWTVTALHRGPNDQRWLEMTRSPIGLRDMRGVTFEGIVHHPAGPPKKAFLGRHLELSPFHGDWSWFHVRR